MSSSIVTFSLSSTLLSSDECKFIDDKQGGGKRRDDQELSLVGEWLSASKIPASTLTTELDESAPAFCPSYCIYCLYISEVLEHIPSLLH